jgi:uncharacterized protein with PIN domain
MAITCPRCGWQYDVTLFQFGRTINCACGERVGLENRVAIPQTAELKFFADVMVHRLVRWLRMLGFDTAWEDAIKDADLVRRAMLEERHILTLDRRLPHEWRVGNVLLLNSDTPLHQLREVISRFEIQRPERFFTRCLICNTPLRPATSEQIDAQVPESVRRLQNDFRHCPHCRKVYWAGSHTERMLAAVENVFSEASGRS